MLKSIPVLIAMGTVILPLSAQKANKETGVDGVLYAWSLPR